GGSISGTPDSGGNSSFQLTAIDANGCPGSQPYQVTIVDNQCPSITISPSTLPGGFAGVPYSQTFSASGGTAPYTFTVAAGGLPDGLTLSSGGGLSGTP